jgi:hypothetical protein
MGGTGAGGTMGTAEMGGGGDRAGMTGAGAGPAGGLAGLAVEDDWVDEYLLLRGIFSN